VKQAAPPLQRANSVTRWLTPTERSYAAGWFEGEGWLSLAPRIRVNGSRAYTLLVGATNTAPETLDFLTVRWGGSRGCYHRASHRPLFTWRLSGRAAAEFLRDMEPFLQSERLRAKLEVALRFYFLPEAGAASDEDLRWRQEACALAMRALNRRGASTLPTDACRDLVADLNRRVLERKELSTQT
jgi:hypothetical protein